MKNQLKKFLSCLLAVAFANFSYGQEIAYNPYEQFEDKTKVLTLSKGKYEEFFGIDSVEIIGDAILNTKTMKVIGFVEEDTSESFVTTEMVERFLSLDPIASSYPFNSPFAFSENRVIDARELEGLEAHVINQGGENKLISGPIDKNIPSSLNGAVRVDDNFAWKILFSVFMEAWGGSSSFQELVMLSALTDDDIIYKISQTDKGRGKAIYTMPKGDPQGDNFKIITLIGRTHVENKNNLEGILAWELNNSKLWKPSGKFEGIYLDGKYGVIESPDDYARQNIEAESESAYYEIMTNIEIGNSDRTTKMLNNAKKYGFVLSEGIGLDLQQQVSKRKDHFMKAYSDYMINETGLYDEYSEEYERIKE